MDELIRRVRKRLESGDGQYPDDIRALLSRLEAAESALPATTCAECGTLLSEEDVEDEQEICISCDARY